jgi:hypothetical protein
MKMKTVYVTVVLAVLFGFVVSVSAVPGVPSGGTLVLAAGTNRYVSNSGSDTTGDGTQGNPWQTIQYGVDHSDVGDIINVAAGTYTGAVLAKDIAVVGAAGGSSIIATGVAYAVGSGLKTGFRLDGTADGAEISNFTVNCNSAASFYFGIFARGADGVVVDSVTVNDPVQGITNRGGSTWSITNNVVTDVVVQGGGGIGICLTVRPPDTLTCSGNYVDGNTISSTATAPDYTCPGIILWLDLRGTSGVPVGTEDLSGNQITGNNITGTGAENQVGIEVGVSGLGGDPSKISAALGMIHDNTVSGNTLDAADFGMYIYTVTNLEVLNNDIVNSDNSGIYLTDGISGDRFSGNNIYGNTYGFLNETGVLVDAENNWWGDDSGPSGAAGGTGDPVSGDVDFTPWIGMNNPPVGPSNLSPTNGATCVYLPPNLQSSSFSDPDGGDAHAASQWQVRTGSGSYSSPVYDSGIDVTHLTSIAVPSLIYSTTYYWHVRHQDDGGAWSDWSAETSFTASPPNGWYEQYTTVGTRASGVYSSFWLSQCFTPETSHDLNTVSFYLYKVGSPTYTVTIGLYAAGSDDRPTGSALCNTAFSASSLTTAAKWYEYDFTTGYQVTAGMKYALVLSADSGSLSNIVYWRVNTAGTYSRGMRATSTNQGSTWTTNLSYDLGFKEGQYPPRWYEQFTAGDSAASGVYTGFWISQSFAPVTTHTLNQVSFKLYKVGSPTYTVTVSLHAAGSDNKPTGPALCSTTFLASSLTTAATWYTYQFSTGYELTAGTEYALVLSASGGASGNMVYWRTSSAGTYSRGMKASSTDQGVTWATNPAQDFMFREGGY